MIQRLVEVTEQHFDCTHGEPRAWFELPQRVGEDIRMFYVTYAVRGKELSQLEQWFVDNVIMPLYEKAGDSARLWWRLKDRFEVNLEVDGMYHLRTRIAVLDKDLNIIRLDEVLKVEGMPATVLDG